MLFNKGRLVIGIAFIAIFIKGCNKDVKSCDPNTNHVTSILEENIDPDCVEFVALWSAGDMVEKLGKDKKWVFLNYTVDLWDIPPVDGKGITVGKLRAYSYARIIEKRGNDYKVESPINQVQGWISSEHVKTISWKNPKTKKLCK